MPEMSSHMSFWVPWASSSAWVILPSLVGGSAGTETTAGTWEDGLVDMAVREGREGSGSEGGKG